MNLFLALGILTDSCNFRNWEDGTGRSGSLLLILCVSFALVFWADVASVEIDARRFQD